VSIDIRVFVCDSISEDDLRACTCGMVGKYCHPVFAWCLNQWRTQSWWSTFAMTSLMYGMEVIDGRWGGQQDRRMDDCTDIVCTGFQVHKWPR